MFIHTLNFKNNEGMSYAAYRVDCFVKDAEAVTENEFSFSGEADNEVTFTTTKQISQTAIKKMVKEFDPKSGFTFNKVA